MKISILLPYKENFSPEYPGAVSIFLNAVSSKSKFKKNITVFGNTNYKKKYNIKSYVRKSCNVGGKKWIREGSEVNSGSMWGQFGLDSESIHGGFWRG